MCSVNELCEKFGQQCKIETSYASVNSDTREHCKNEVLHSDYDNGVSKMCNTDPRIFLKNMAININVIEYPNLVKMSALKCFAEGKELEGICYLTESHAVCVRQQIIQRSIKTKYREQYMNQPQKYGLNSTYVNYDFNENVWTGDMLSSRLKELPSEWYMVQVTAQYEPFSYKHQDSLKYPLSEHVHPAHAIHITVFPTGCNVTEPMCITLPAPKPNSMYDILTEIGTVLYNMKSDLEATYKNKRLYWSMREKQDNKMKNAMIELETTWLREWRILFMADFLHDVDLVKQIHDTLDEFINADFYKTTQRDRWLLKKVAIASCFLTKVEVARAIKYILPNNCTLARKIVQFILRTLPDMNSFYQIKRKVLVLIIDERMDHIPFETLQILKNHPVTRMPSFHIAYSLYKEYEESMEKGCKIIKVGKNIGTFIVNPSKDLNKTEQRLKQFHEYWLPEWNGIYGEPPTQETFETSIVNHDLLVYSGHGSGMEYLPGDQIERLRVKAVVMLFGCSSVELTPMGGQIPPYGISNHYLTARSPCVLGMLCVVTDTDIDRFTVYFLSKWLKSKAERPWTDVDLNSWCRGTLTFSSDSLFAKATRSYEPEMLRAVATERWSCMRYMTSASVAVRGLPIKLVYDD